MSVACGDGGSNAMGGTDGDGGAGSTEATSEASEDAADDESGSDGADDGIPWTEGTASLEVAWSRNVECNGASGWIGDGVDQLLKTSTGGLWVAGFFHGDCGMFDDGFVDSDGTDAFSAELTVDDGSVVQEHKLDGPGLQAIDEGASSAAGSAMVGRLTGPITIGGSLLEPSAPDTTDRWLARLDPDGEAVWVRRFDDASFLPLQLDLADDGRVALLGAPLGPIDVGVVLDTSLLSPFVVVYDAEGEVAFATVVTPQGFLSPQFTAVRFGPDGDVWIAGTTYGQLTFGEASPVGPDFSDINSVFVVRMSDSGEVRWLWSDTPPAVHHAPILEVAPDGTSTIVFTTDAPEVVQFAPDGSLAWRRRFETEDVHRPILAIAPDDAVVVGLAYTDAIVVDEQTIGTAGRRDVLLMELDEDGDVTWWQRFGTEWDEGLRGGIVVLDDGLALLATLGQPTTFGLADVVRLRPSP